MRPRKKSLLVRCNAIDDEFSYRMYIGAGMTLQTRRYTIGAVSNDSLERSSQLQVVLMSRLLFITCRRQSFLSQLLTSSKCRRRVRAVILVHNRVLMVVSVLIVRLLVCLEARSIGKHHQRACVRLLVLPGCALVSTPIHGPSCCRNVLDGRATAHFATRNLGSLRVPDDYLP